MDPRKLYADERLIGPCVYCGQAPPTTTDHVPSKVLLDDPLPADLPVVSACNDCNQSFSSDEVYVACFIECIKAGSTETEQVGRDKVRRILAVKPAIAARIETCLQQNEGGLLLTAESNRISNVIMKLARGHVAYELSEPRVDEPRYLQFMALSSMTNKQRQAFEEAPAEDVFPEIGSRTFVDSFCANTGLFLPSGWNTIQEGRYRYLVSWSGPLLVRFVISEHLACDVAW
jgi:hypothetical protein